MSSPPRVDPPEPAEGGSSSAPVEAAGATIEAEVSRSEFRSSTLMLTLFAGIRLMTGMTMIRQ
jgi:hypothetical protein